MKFENDNKIFEKYEDFFILLDETLDKSFTDKNKSFIEYRWIWKNRNELEKLSEKFLKYILEKNIKKNYFLYNIIIYSIYILSYSKWYEIFYETVPDI